MLELQAMGQGQGCQADGKMFEEAQWQRPDLVPINSTLLEPGVLQIWHLD